MNPKIAVAVGLAAVFASIFALPQAAFAADVNVSITTGSTTKTTDAYDPNPVEVNVGDTVIWTNNDSTLHTATSGTASDGPAGVFGGTAEAPIYIAPKTTQKYAFTEAGEFPYYCTLHPTMVGTVMVAAGGNGSTGGEFTATATTADGQSFEVMGMSEGVTGAEVTINEGESVDIAFEGSGDVELTLPKAMIDGISETAMAGDQEVPVTIVSENEESTTISVAVPEGTTTVTLMGKMVVPEFPVAIVLILAATMVAIIGYTRFAKGGLHFLGRA